MTNEFSSQFATAVGTSMALQWLKAQPWFPLLNYENEKLNRMVSMVVAFFSGAGILFAYNHTAGSLTITGLTVANLYHLFGHAAQQWLTQHATYKLLVAPPKPGADQAQERKKEPPPALPA